MSALAPLVGHEELRTGLARSVASGELPGSLLFHGPAGIGKQRLALWLAQLLLCERPGDQPCGECRGCRLAASLEHPDLHWFFPMVRPKGASSPDKLAEALEQARAEELAARRQDPLQPLVPGEPVGFFLPQIQTLRRFAASRPAMGRRKVFIIGQAELLVAQEGSQEAANALLKVLEEPPADTTMVLTSSDPDALLPTIRSRLLPVRVLPLQPEQVAGFLIEQRGTQPAEATRVARLAQGSIGRALGFLPLGDQPGPLEDLRRQARALLEAAASGTPARRAAAALNVAPAGARGAFSSVLEALATWVRDLGAVAAGAPELALNSDAVPDLHALARKLPRAAAGAPLMLRHVEEARQLAYGNVNPQLILATLLNRLAQAVS